MKNYGEILKKVQSDPAVARENVKEVSETFRTLIDNNEYPVVEAYKGAYIESKKALKEIGEYENLKKEFFTDYGIKVVVHDNGLTVILEAVPLDV